MLHWLRYSALPEGEDQPDLQAALAEFTRVHPTAPQLVPDQLQPLLASAATPSVPANDVAAGLNEQAARILRNPQTTGNLDALNRAVELLQRAMAATPTDHRGRAGYLANLGLALHNRFERTGAIADLDAAISAGQQALDATPRRAPRPGRHSVQPWPGVADQV